MESGREKRKTLRHIVFYTRKTREHVTTYEPNAERRRRRTSRLLLCKELLHEQIREKAAEVKERFDRERGKTE